MEELSLNRNNSDLGNLSESSESVHSSSSCFSSESERLPWLENVGPDGSLFYVQCDSYLDPFLDESANGSYPAEASTDNQKLKSKFNPAAKLKKWMKNRQKKVRKSFPLLKSSRNEANFNSFPPVDTFLHLQSKDVFMYVDVSKIATDSKLTLAEKFFGLKLSSLEDNFAACETPVIIGKLYNEDMPDIKIGDSLMSVNDINVNLNNIENILKEIPIPSKVKLNIMSSVSQVTPKSHFLPSKHNDLIKELAGDFSAVQCAKLQCQDIPHGLFYLSVGSDMSENEDVMFKYPNEDSLLFQVRGMFLTLVHLMSPAIASSPLSSCSVKVQGEVVHIGFVKREENIMILALPASVASVYEVQQFSTALSKLLTYQYSSLQKAFIVGNDESYLDNFLTLYFKHYLSSTNYTQTILSEPHLLDILDCAHWLPLPIDIKTEIDDILSELESSDFGNNSDGFYGNRRIYNIFGSCLFYKGYLLCSHLPKKDLLDINLYLRYNHLLELTHTQAVSQMIIWKEVFPSRHQEGFSNPDPEFEESHGRWFMLIVVKQHCILAVLLDDGGCALIVEGNPPPEPFYVEEVENTLFILQDCGITAAIEKLLHFSVFPVVSPDLFFKNNSTQHSLASMFASSASISVSGPNFSSEHSTSHSSLTAEKEGLADGESDTESSCSNDSNDMASFEKQFRSYSVSTGSTTKSHASSECSQIGKDQENEYPLQSFSSLHNLNGMNSSGGIRFDNSFRMASGFGNKLFYYLYMDAVEGILVSPIVPNYSSTDSLLKSILDNFHRCCLNMQKSFKRSLRNEEITKTNYKTKYGVSMFLQSVFEQGVLFQCNELCSGKQKASYYPVYFWVIGRLFLEPEPRVCYVCHRDAVPQDIVEMAFRLGFGFSL